MVRHYSFCKILIFCACLVSSFNLTAQCTNAVGCLGGNAFNDINCNGLDDATEPGVIGVHILVYDDQNMAVDSVVTDINGDWEICGLVDGDSYRVEFVIPDSVSLWAQPTHAGADNGSTVQFVQPGSCANLG